MNILTTLQSYMVYPFVRYALIAGVLIALCSSLLGVTLVLKRFSYIGDGLSHVAFGAMAVATVVSVGNNMVIVMPVTIISAILLLSQNGATNIRGDAALAMISVGALAFGYLVLNVFSKSANLSGDVCSTLFGSTSILTLKAVDVWICVLMSIVVVGLFTFFYHKLFAITFDADFARATGVPAGAYDVLIAVVTAVVIVLAMNLVGSLLTSALIVFPALSAMQAFKSYRQVVVCSAVISVLCAVLGIFISILASTPVGSTIVAANVLFFLVFYTLGKIRRGNI